MDYVVDTSFLIRRWRSGVASPEQRFVNRHPGAGVAMRWIVKAEFLRGAALARHDHEEVTRFLGRFRTLWPGDETVRTYVRTFVALRDAGTMIGPHDLWIAASALEHDLPLLTRNRDEFARVPELVVPEYESA